MVTFAYSVQKLFYRYQTAPETANKRLHIPAEDLCSTNLRAAAELQQEVENVLSALGPSRPGHQTSRIFDADVTSQ